MTPARSKRLHLIAASLGAAALLSACDGTGPERTEILWDEWGIPHVYGKTQEDLFFAFGWAQARSHGNLLLRLYGEGRARSAEYWGEEFNEHRGWTNLQWDSYLLTVGVPARAQQWYEAQAPEFRRCLDAFADGINAFAREQPDAISDEVEVVLPVDATDVLALSQLAVLFSFVTDPHVVQAAQHQLAVGSNAWAIAPSRSASGNAMLLANPHLYWIDHDLLFEAHLVGPGVNVYGATYVGGPTLVIAFNDFLGWTHTNNTHDGADLYHLELTDGGYRWDGEVREFESRDHSIKVKLPDGGLREEPLRVCRSVHGPVVAEVSGSALALRMVGLDQPGMLEAWWDMGRSTNLAEFEAVLQRMQLPMFTVMYADREGHILHLFGGLTPIRPEGEWDWSWVVPGSTSTTLWTEVHPYNDLPRVLDPASGWLQNANDPPWTTTFPRALDPDDYPDYMAQPPSSMSFRAKGSARMLLEDESITFEELVAYKHSTRVEAADHVLDDVIAAARMHGGPPAQRAADVLEEWDRKTDAESRGAVLFQTVTEELYSLVGSRFFAVPWDPESPLDTPAGIADTTAAAAAVETAACNVEARYGRLDVPWGEVHRFRRGDVDLPANGFADPYGVFRAAFFAEAEDGRLVANGGDTYVAAIEFSNPVRAMAVLGYGNASQPGSPHITDQLQFLARKELRPVWRTREEIEAHVSHRTSFEAMRR
jgi:acyl-homoserine-lactone acylase